MVALGARGDLEPACDRGAVKARGEELEDLALAGREALDHPALVQLARDAVALLDRQRGVDFVASVRGGAAASVWRRSGIGRASGWRNAG